MGQRGIPHSFFFYERLVPLEGRIDNLGQLIKDVPQKKIVQGLMMLTPVFSDEEDY